MNETDKTQAFCVMGDNPIISQDDDWLNFNDFVQPLAERLIASIDNTPFTVGVLADWGQGKTSVMRMLPHHMVRALEIQRSRGSVERTCLHPSYPDQTKRQPDQGSQT